MPLREFVENAKASCDALVGQAVLPDMELEGLKRRVPCQETLPPAAACQASLPDLRLAHVFEGTRAIEFRTDSRGSRHLLRVSIGSIVKMTARHPKETAVARKKASCAGRYGRNGVTQK